MRTASASSSGQGVWVGPDGVGQRGVQGRDSIGVGRAEHLEDGFVHGFERAGLLTQLPNTLRTTAFARRVTRR